MSSDPLVDDIQRRLSKEVDHITASLASGAAGTHKEYKRLVGKIQGLRLAQEAVAESALTYLYDKDD